MKCWYIFDCCLLSDHNHNFYMNRPHIHLTLSIDLFTDTAAILISIVSNSYYGIPGGKYILICPLRIP